jgi:putative hemolysin
MEITVLVILILVNGFFAMSEISLVSARRARLQVRIDDGDRGAAIAADLGAEPTRFLSTVQIGITSVAMLSGIVGEATLAPPLAERLVGQGLTVAAAHIVATAIVVLLITYFSIVIGELVPKRLGQIHAETIARIVARPILWLSQITRPFVWLLTRSTQILLRVLGVRDDSRAQITEDEIHAVLQEGSSAGVIEEQEHRMVRNLFRLDERSIASLMTPRADIVSLPLKADRAELLRRIDQSPHSHYPVVRDGQDDVIGVVSARALLAAVLRDDPIDLEKLASPPTFTPDRVTGMDMLEALKAADTHLSLVVDEYGSLVGLVTLHDLIEAIAGGLGGTVNEQRAVRRADGSWLLDGEVPIADVLDTLPVRVRLESLGADFETLSGMIMAELGRLPGVGDRVDWYGWRFEVVDLDGRRIDKVLATALRLETNEGDGG